MGSDDICYNQAWTEKVIEELELELCLEKKLHQDVQVMLQQSLEAREMFSDILTQIEALEQSLRITKQALCTYMEAAEKYMAEAVSLYEDKLEKTSALFSEC